MSVAVTARVWLKVNNLKWVGGTVESVNEKDLTIRKDDGEVVNVARGSEALSQRTPANLEAVDNLTSLPDLDEPNMLNSLCVRYKMNKIYTFTGPILVCMNPWQDLGLYEQHILKQYRGKPLHAVPPHVFAIAECAFANLQALRKDQTILVSGDSGSGKTESTKFMMQYLANVAHHTAVTANTEHQVLQCNPVLEAFGNAKTLRNDNSSRFGKYIDIHFDEAFALCGAKIDTYLLEKSRVVGQEAGERNFHIFYQLCQGQQNNGISQALASTLRLLPSNQFTYTKVGSNVSVGYKPANSFQHTVNALEEIGFKEAERNEIFKVVSAVLHMGNIKIKKGDNQNAQLSTSDPDAMLTASLLGVDCKGMVDAMTIRNIQAGGKESTDNYVVNQTQQQAFDARDALARALYGNLFDLLVTHINATLSQHAAGKMRNISILDIFGFEHFKTNHFEQFCINYANEKLQGHFNEFNFSHEIQEYQREGIQWSYDDFYFQTNTKCIELIEAKGKGMLALLDEQCIMPNGNDETYCTKLKSDIPSHPHLFTAKMRGLNFTLKHYAAEVVYNAEGFCFKNRDPVQPAIVELMHNSTSKYVQDIFQGHWDKMQVSKSPSDPERHKGGGGAKSSLIFDSVTFQFKKQLQDLMCRINAAQPHFVRCINPNSVKQAGILEPEIILDQLRCSGLMEAVRVSRAGFPVRIPHMDFVKRYTILLNPGPGDPTTQCGRMCQAFRLPPEHFRMGKTKVFMRRNIHDKLEEERSKLLVKQVLTLQRVTRGHFARKLKRRLLEERRGIFRPPTPVEAPPGEGDETGPEGKAVVIGPDGKPILGVPPGQSPNFTPGGAVKQLPPRQITYAGASAKLIKDLEVKLTSVRELYYNERVSQLALSELMKEIRTLNDPDEIMARIRQLEDKIVQQRKEQQTAAVPEEDANRRVDSLMACMALLEDKLNLVLHANRSNPGWERYDAARIQSSEMGSKLRVAEMELHAARSELRRKDEEIAALRQMAAGTAQGAPAAASAPKPAVGVIDYASAAAGVDSRQLLDERAVLEKMIREEQRKRGEEFVDMDANVRARDDRILELEATTSEMQRRLVSKDETLRNQKQQIMELTQMIRGSTNASPTPQGQGQPPPQLTRQYSGGNASPGGVLRAPSPQMMAPVPVGGGSPLTPQASSPVTSSPAMGLPPTGAPGGGDTLHRAYQDLQTQNARLNRELEALGVRRSPGNDSGPYASGQPVARRSSIGSYDASGAGYRYVQTVDGVQKDRYFGSQGMVGQGNGSPRIAVGQGNGSPMGVVRPASPSVGVGRPASPYDQAGQRRQF